MKKLRLILMMPWECIKMSFANIAHNRLRSFLTILGIMIGVSAVIALITTISGVSNSISDSFTSMGAGRLTVSISGNDIKSGLSSSDMDSIAALEQVDGLTPTVAFSTNLARGGIRETGIKVSGVNSYYFERNADAVRRGRSIDYLDVMNMERVCLIGQTVLDDFFYGVNPIGETVYLNNLPFSVVGILSEDETTYNVLIPYTSALRMNSSAYVTSLSVYLSDTSDSDSAKSALEALLDRLFSYEEDCYTITTMEVLESTMDQLLGMMSSLLAGIASIALIVGGIGIMNMMLTSVTERTNEIGLKKALGAQSGQIQLQFLMESFILSMMGGIIGVVLGLILSYAMCSVMGTRFAISYGAVALGAGFSAAVGIIFGWAPARKASRLNPIDALRSQ